MFDFDRIFFFISNFILPNLNKHLKVLEQSIQSKFTEFPSKLEVPTKCRNFFLSKKCFNHHFHYIFTISIETMSWAFTWIILFDAHFMTINRHLNKRKRAYLHEKCSILQQLHSFSSNNKKNKSTSTASTWKMC